MSRLVRTVLGASAILVLVVAAYVAVGPRPGAAREAASTPVFEGSSPATPRGLAAAVVEHLGDRQVTAVAGSGGDGLVVSVDTDDPAVASITVFVSESLDGPSTCGRDSGYTQVFCESDPWREVVRRAPGGQEPTFIGRTDDADRGNVLVMVHGDSDDREVAALVRDLVDDEHVGLVSSERLEGLGRDLDLGQLRFEAEMTPVS